MEKGRISPPLWIRLFLPGALFLLYSPLAFLMVRSFYDPAHGWSLTWYQEILADQAMIQALGRSLWVAFMVGLMATSLAAAVSIAVHLSDWRIKRVFSSMSHLLLMIPELVLGLALLNWFFMLNLTLSLGTVIVAHVTLTLSFGVLTCMARLSQLNFDMIEAGRDLGASEAQLFNRVLIPFLKPALVSSFLLCFFLSFDDFVITYYTNGVGTDTLPVKLYSAMKMGHSPKLNALATLLMVISAIAFYFSFRLKRVLRS